MLHDTSYFRCRLLKWQKTAELETAPINWRGLVWLARHSCSLRPTYQGVHVACLWESRDGVPSKVFDQCYPGRIVTRVGRYGSQEQGKLVGIREGRCRRAKRYLNHVPIGYNLGQCFGDLGTSGTEQKWHEVLFSRRVQGVKEPVHGHSRVALEAEKWKFR